MSPRICRVALEPAHGVPFAFELDEEGMVAVLRFDARTAMWGEIGRGRWVNGEVLGAPCRDEVGPQLYAALEVALDVYMGNPLR